MFYVWMLVICYLIGHGHLIKMSFIMEILTLTLLRLKVIAVLWLIHLVVKLNLVLKQMESETQVRTPYF